MCPPCYPAIIEHFPTSFTMLRLWVPIFSNLKLPTPPPPSSLSALDLDCYFTEKNRNNHKENFHKFPPTPPPTHQHLGPICCLSPVTRDELSIFLSEAKLSTCSLDPNPFKYSRTLLQIFLLFLCPTLFFLLIWLFHQHTKLRLFLSSILPSRYKFIFPFFFTAIPLKTCLYSFL